MKSTKEASAKAKVKGKQNGPFLGTTKRSGGDGDDDDGNGSSDKMTESHNNSKWNDIQYFLDVSIFT